MKSIIPLLLVLSCLCLTTHQSMLKNSISAPRSKDSPMVQADSFTAFWVNMWYFFTQPGS